MGVSVRRYLGWEPGEVTTFEYDDAGRVASSVTVREPEFSFMDRAWFADLWAQEHVQRGSHGISIEEATDPANRGKFVVPLPTTDFAAKALNDMQKAYRDAYGDRAGMDHLLWRVEKVD